MRNHWEEDDIKNMDGCNKYTHAQGYKNHLGSTVAGLRNRGEVKNICEVWSPLTWPRFQFFSWALRDSPKDIKIVLVQQHNGTQKIFKPWAYTGLVNSPKRDGKVIVY